MLARSSPWCRLPRWSPSLRSSASCGGVAGVDQRLTAHESRNQDDESAQHRCQNPVPPRRSSEFSGRRPAGRRDLQTGVASRGARPAFRSARGAAKRICVSRDTDRCRHSGRHLLGGEGGHRSTRCAAVRKGDRRMARQLTEAGSGNADTAPDPDDPSKPESPTDLSKPSALYVLRKTVREFGTDQCTDLAAALTYYAVLSLFPALVVVVSLLGVFGQGQRTTDALLQIIDDVGPASAVDTLRAPIEQLVESPSAGVALIVGILGALWSASGYIGAFGRAMNRIYEVEEGRPVWKLRPIQLLLTLVGLSSAAVVVFMLAVSGPVASAIGGAI